MGYARGCGDPISEKGGQAGAVGPCGRAKGQCLTRKSSNTGRTRKATTKPTRSAKTVVSQGPGDGLRDANLEPPESWVTSQAPRCSSIPPHDTLRSVHGGAREMQAGRASGDLSSLSWFLI